MQNKKLIISLFSLCLVAIVGLLATVIVFAATTQNITSQITISYTATEVAGTLKANYKIGSNEEVSMGQSTFTADTAKAGTLTAKELSLTAANPTVIFTYTFTNASDKTAKMTLTDALTTTDNVTIQYCDELDGTYSAEIPSVTANKNDSASIYVKMTITDKAKNVGLGGQYTVVITQA